MFLENDYAEPLFSLSGGPPKAFRCKLCGLVYITERWIKMHLKHIHNWEEQPCLSSMENDKTEQGGPRQLRAGAPIFQKSNDIQKDTEKIQPNQKSAETSDVELPLPMREEK